MSKFDLKDRMKAYEEVSKTKLTRRTPVIIRLDGRAFHTFTRGLNKPYDEILNTVMDKTMLNLIKEVQNVQFGYTQSDEISLLMLDTNTLTTDAWFDNEVQKICSICASICTMEFYKNLQHELANRGMLGNEVWKRKLESGATFDCRCFNIPFEEIHNYFLFRHKDCVRNSIEALAQSLFPQKELMGLNRTDLIDKMREEKDVDWVKQPDRCKYGSMTFRIPETICTAAVPEIFDTQTRILEQHE